MIAFQFCIDNDSYEGKSSGERLIADGYMPANTYLEVFLSKVTGAAADVLPGVFEFISYEALHPGVEFSLSTAPESLCSLATDCRCKVSKPCTSTSDMHPAPSRTRNAGALVRVYHDESTTTRVPQQVYERERCMYST